MQRDSVYYVQRGVNLLIGVNRDNPGYGVYTSIYWYKLLTRKNW